jgi:hypothetical protein
VEAVVSGPGHGGPARGYSWEKFTAGHTKSTIHGAKSPRKVGPIAEQIKHDLLTNPAYPEYLRDPSYLPTIDRYSWAEGQVILLRAWTDEHDLADALSEREEREEHEERAKSSTTRRSTSRRLQSAYDQLHKTETRAANLAKSLGLDPASRARILRDLSQAGWYAGGVRPLDAALERIRLEREHQAAAIEAGSDDD